MDDALQAVIAADLLISGATLLTLDAERRVIEDGALAVRGDRIVAVGKRAQLAPRVQAARTIAGERFVVTPGFVDAHIHITGDPLTRGVTRGAPGEGPGEIMRRWVIPLFRAHTPKEEAISARLAALAMLRRGTTFFVEAGTVSHLDAVMEALEGTGIRGRIGEWVEGREWDPAPDPKPAADEAIAVLEREVERWPERGGRLAAWPILVGHSTNPDPVWRAAKAIADDRGLMVTAHMSPRATDPEWFLKAHGRRPLEHLADIGVLGPNVALTHLAQVDQAEVDALAQTGARAITCPVAAVQGGMGLSKIGLFPEMLERGVPVMLGTDGVATDILASARVMAGLFRDARCDQTLLPAARLLELATAEAGRAIGMEAEIGSLEVGKKADFVLHDTHRPEWGPVFDPVAQLALSAPPDGVHSVFVDGVAVIEAGRATFFDEEELMAQARAAGRALVERTGLPVQSPWPRL